MGNATAICSDKTGTLVSTSPFMCIETDINMSM